MRLIDPEALASFRELNGDEETNFTKSFFEEVLKSVQLRRQNLNQAASAKDVARLAFEAHAFKSTCANAGVGSMTELCHKLEQFGRAGAGDWSQVATWLSELARLSELLKQEIAALPELGGAGP